jgi:DNA-binding NarL/FixJ family response regulator
VEIAQRRIGVVIHSDDPVVRSGIVSIIRQRPELNLLADGDQSDSSVLVLCVDTVDDAALETLRRYWRTGKTQTVLLVGSIREAELFGALECGVRAIVRRQEASPERIVRAVQSAVRGAGELPSDLLGGLLGSIGRALRGGTVAGDVPLTGFSDREIEVIRLVGEGLETREIAEKLAYSERTVKNVLQGVMLRLDLRNRPHMIAYAAREGYLR